LNDPVMLRLDEDRFWFSLASSDVLFHAMGLAAHAGLDVRIGEADAAPLQVQGHRVARAGRRPVRGRGRRPRLLPVHTGQRRRHPGDRHPHRVDRRAGVRGKVLDPARGTDSWEQIMRAGRSYQVRPAGPSDIRRVEAGILNWGADMTYEQPLRGRAGPPGGPGLRGRLPGQAGADPHPRPRCAPQAGRRTWSREWSTAGAGNHIILKAVPALPARHRTGH
jgi:hypothetical protein